MSFLVFSKRYQILYRLGGFIKKDIKRSVFIDLRIFDLKDERS